MKVITILKQAINDLEALDKELRDCKDYLSHMSRSAEKWKELYEYRRAMSSLDLSKHQIDRISHSLLELHSNNTLAGIEALDEAVKNYDQQ